jgi:tetratricopeptide (TPR) repeat protein
MSAQLPGQLKPAEDRPTANDKKRLQAAIAQAFELLAAGAPQEALAHIRPFTDVATKSDVGAYVFGLIFFNADDPRTALEWFERAVAFNPCHVDALSARAIVLQRLGQPGEALRAYEAVLVHRPDDIDTMFNIGVTFQSLGQMAEALAAYEALLRVDPGHVEALTNRGVLLQRFQRFDDALDCFTAIEASRPDDTRNLVNKGSVLQRLGRHDEALAAYDAAAQRSPQDADTEICRANLLLHLGRYEEAIDCYDRALFYGPLHAQTLFNKGIALQGLGRAAAALEAYEAALELEPGFTEALCNRGNALHELGRLAEAVESYEAALGVRPTFVPALVNRATIFLRCGRYADAVASCNDVLRVDPGNARAFGLRGTALQKLGRLDDALAALDNAIECDPGIAETWLNRGNVLQELDRQEDAIAAYQEAMRVRPDYPEALSGLGVALKDLGRIDEALTKFDEALRLRPSYPDARNNRAGALLASGMLKAGFEDYEARWDRSNAPPKTVVSTLPAWDGGNLFGKRILIWDEQGLGDLVQFCRYLPLLADLGADATFFCRRKMHRLLRSLGPAVRLVDAIDPAESFAVQSALMSLPRGFQTTLDTIPGRVPYLHAEADLVARWAERIGGDGFRIGICWRGNAHSNLQRSIPLQCFAELAGIEGVRLVSLRKEAQPRTVEAKGRNFVVESLGPEFDAGPDAFIDTAAAMATLDLVVTSDTSIAHLAGALGRPVLLALKYAPDWRWLRDRDDCPWYPTMRLFRQTRPGDWDGVFARIAAWVAPLVAARSVTRRSRQPTTSIDVPISVGELIDKITTFEIEVRRIEDPAKLADARRELALLRMARLQAGIDCARLRELERELADVNERLWHCRNSLRECETLRPPEAELVDLIREMSRCDDARKSLKQTINSSIWSTTIDEKFHAIAAPGRITGP